jgi:predicted transcriptional regulator
MSVKLTEKSMEVITYIQDNGGEVSIAALAAGVGRTERSVGANVTDLTKKGLASREKVDEGGEKPVTYVVLSEEGKTWTQPKDAE